MKKITLLISVLTIINSCAGSQVRLKMLQDGGTLRIEPSTESGYDYKVFIKNTVDFGWDGDRKEDREKVVNSLLSEDCKKIQIISDNPIQTGTYALNKPALTWVMKVKCEK